MKYLDDKEVMRGDAVIAATADGQSVVCGTVHEIYERTNQVRITGYALRVEAEDCVLAQEAFDAYTKPLLAARAKAKAEAEAAEQAKLKGASTQAATPEAPPVAPDTQNAPEAPPAI